MAVLLIVLDFENAAARGKPHIEAALQRLGAVRAMDNRAWVLESDEDPRAVFDAIAAEIDPLASLMVVPLSRVLQQNISQGAVQALMSAGGNSEPDIERRD